jgi:adenosylmethionine-8-amino-7-oxononanoate aminotransferase
MSSLSLSERDKQIIWHPFTQAQTAAECLAIKRAKGSYVYDENDKAYLDLISSWWVNIHGHGHPEIAASIYEQAQELEHVIFAGFTHLPAIELCENLSRCLPPSLKRFFFSDNGSTSVEAALKIAYQYWHNLGDSSRSLFLSFDGGYHGDTVGAMSVGRSSGFHNAFSGLLFKTLIIPYPDTWDGDDTTKAKETQALEVLHEHLSKLGNKIAALIVEPLVQGAAGMRMCRPSFVKSVVNQVRQHGILVIFDEVMTGFGRTGTTFGLEQIGIVPDLLCLSKGITGGFLPLAVTVVTDNIYSAFLHDEWRYAFAHGHSYTANPVACRAAITSLNLLLNADTQYAIQSINKAHLDGIKYLKANCDAVTKTRVLGTIGAFEVRIERAKIISECLKAGLLVRPLGEVVYLLPPYSTMPSELYAAYEAIAQIIKNTG